MCNTLVVEPHRVAALCSDFTVNTPIQSIPRHDKLHLSYRPKYLAFILTHFIICSYTLVSRDKGLGVDLGIGRRLPPRTIIPSQLSLYSALSTPKRRAQHPHEI